MQDIAPPAATASAVGRHDPAASSGVGVLRSAQVSYGRSTVLFLQAPCLVCGLLNSRMSVQCQLLVQHVFCLTCSVAATIRITPWMHGLTGLHCCIDCQKGDAPSCSSEAARWWCRSGRSLLPVGAPSLETSCMQPLHNMQQENDHHRR